MSIEMEPQYKEVTINRWEEQVGGRTKIFIESEPRIIETPIIPDPEPEPKKSIFSRMSLKSLISKMSPESNTTPDAISD